MTVPDLLRLGGLAALTAAAGHGLAILLRPGAGQRLEAGFLRWARIAFLALSAALAWDLGTRAGSAPWGWFAWLACFTLLHTHRVKAYKGTRTAAAGVLGWALAALAWLATR